MKEYATVLLVAVLLCAGCDSPPPTEPPAPKTAEPYTGIYQTEVNVLQKAQSAAEVMQQSEAERQQKMEQATQ